MHNWSDENVDWEGLNDAGPFIGEWLRRWVRMGVRDMKEKWGTVRVYCGFGWHSFYEVYRPGYCWVPKWWPYTLDLVCSKWIMPIVNRLIVPIQMKAYRWRYKKAVQKWPHLRDEILCAADYGELLRGL